MKKGWERAEAGYTELKQWLLSLLYTKYLNNQKLQFYRKDYNNDKFLQNQDDVCDRELSVKQSTNL
jgi:hypothetical protein